MAIAQNFSAEPPEGTMENSYKSMHTISRLNGSQAELLLPQLISLVQDAVTDGASIGFLHPLAAGDAENYWSAVLQEMAKQTRIILIAEHDGDLLGTVQLSLCTRPNGLHRAEVQKLLVHTRWRGLGIGKALMSAIEQEARTAQRSLLYLDTEADKPAEKLYERTGWTRAGGIPGYACSPDGHLHNTVIFYRKI